MIQFSLTRFRNGNKLLIKLNFQKYADLITPEAQPVSHWFWNNETV